VLFPSLYEVPAVEISALGLSEFQAIATDQFDFCDLLPYLCEE